MHPNPLFAWKNESEMRAFSAERGFGLLCVAAQGMIITASVPFVWLNEGRIGFHVARSNPIRDQLEGAQVVLCVQGTDSYISPDWYGIDDQVPTWNYVMVEIRGSVAAMSQAKLVELLDRLSDEFEARLAPKKVWKREKMTPDRFDAMLGAIEGFELAVAMMQGVRKLSQNKAAPVRATLVEALKCAGDESMAALVGATLAK